MEHSLQSKQSNFFNGWEVVASTSFFLYMFIGGRGIGKTYSILKGLIEDECRFMYVRRTDVELKNCCKSINNPFKTLNVDLGREIELDKAEDSYIIHEGEKTIGIGGSLSTFGKFRGSDFSDIDYIVFDEFINTSPINTIKNESDMFFNMIETVQRNREILGKNSIKVILLANSNRLDNGIIRTLKLGEIIRRMKINGIHEFKDVERGLYIGLPFSKISDLKKDTALYKLTKGTDFYDMAIGNDFVNDIFDDVVKINPKKLVPIVTYENVTFYRIKDNGLMYASYRKANCERYTKETFRRFKINYGLFIGEFIESKCIYYEDYDLKLTVLNIF